MADIDNGGPAFPVNGYSDGLAKRDYFAAAAMQGLLSHCGFADIGPDTIAAVSYAHADFMLAERAKVRK